MRKSMIFCIYIPLISHIYLYILNIIENIISKGAGQSSTCLHVGECPK